MFKEYKAKAKQHIDAPVLENFNFILLTYHNLMDTFKNHCVQYNIKQQ